MDQSNQSTVTEFILLGFSHVPHLKVMLIVVFSIVYISSLVGNSLIFIITNTDSRLQTPMYFFLGNFSLLDIFYPSVVVPKILSDLVTEDKTISYAGCMAQVYFFVFFATTECVILTVMATDRYIAICQPLKYHAIWNQDRCSRVATASWVSVALYSLMHTLVVTRLDFCGPNVVDHFYCDLQPLFQLACSDITLNLVILFLSVFVMAMGNSVLTVMSYVYIISATLKIQSKEGRMKIFSTCGSHLMVVALFYGTIIVTYLQPMTSSSQSNDRTAPVIYTIITPMLNPLIYSLRNKEVKGALKRLFGKKVSS